MQSQNNSNQNDEIQIVSSPYQFPPRSTIVRTMRLSNIEYLYLSR
jgi:hypothetical protein